MIRKDVTIMWNLPDADRATLRELAARQAEIAALPVMAARKQQW